MRLDGRVVAGRLAAADQGRVGARRSRRAVVLGCHIRRVRDGPPSLTNDAGTGCYARAASSFAGVAPALPLVEFRPMRPPGNAWSRTSTTANVLTPTSSSTSPFGRGRCEADHGSRYFDSLTRWGQGGCAPRPADCQFDRAAFDPAVHVEQIADTLTGITSARWARTIAASGARSHSQYTRR